MQPDQSITGRNTIFGGKHLLKTPAACAAFQLNVLLEINNKLNH